MSEKADELEAAIQKLSGLVDKLRQAERSYDQALDHAARYLGNDDSIENARDDKARSAYEEVIKTKKEIELQAQSVQQLVSGN